MNMALSEQRIRNNKIRRRRELRRRRRACALIILLMTLFLSTFFSLRTQAESNKDEALSKYYTSIQVKSGDTLWHYARQYGNRQYYKNSREYVDEVMMINSLQDDTIITGQYLILPYYCPSHKSHKSTSHKSTGALSRDIVYEDSTPPSAGQL